MLLPVALVALMSVASFVSETFSLSPSCLDDSGKPVDWFIVYKFPVIKDSKDELLKSGYTYAYMTSNSIGMLSGKRGGSNTNKLNQTQWTISDKLITNPDSMILSTLSIAYNQNLDNYDSLNSVFYNDDPPASSDGEKSKKNQRRAHAKGVVLVDESTGDGFWLSHTTPNFPPRKGEVLKYAKNSRTPAQTFICLNFDLNESGKQILAHLINMRPLVYQSYFSADLLSWMPTLSNLKVDGFKKVRMSEKGDGRLAQVIKTRAGQELSLYSKSGQFTEDLFNGWLSEELNSNLYVETWRNGNGGALNSSCPYNGPHVNNINELKVRSDDLEVNWNYRKDHSKWAISDSAETAIVCMGDMNRSKSQFTRGGGAICIKCPKCWNIFSDTILEVEACGVGKKKG